MSSNQNKVTEGAKTKDAEICLLKLDHLRTIANFPDETGKYLVRNKNKKTHCALLFWAMIRETNLLAFGQKLLVFMMRISTIENSPFLCFYTPRSYWISDISWTCDDLFVVCITKRGSVAILSRLGEPLVIQSEGCSVEHGPQYFLPFHPLITVV